MRFGPKSSSHGPPFYQLHPSCTAHARVRYGAHNLFFWCQRGDSMQSRSINSPSELPSHKLCGHHLQLPSGLDVDALRWMDTAKTPWATEQCLSPNQVSKVGAI